MSGPPSSRSPRPTIGPGRAGRRRERGGVSWVSLLLLVAVVGGSYLAWVWVPIYYDDLTVKQIVADYANRAVKNADDAGLRREMVTKLAAIARAPALDQRGQPTSVPAIQVDERAVTWERDAATATLRISFEYERAVTYPLLDRTAVKAFSVDKTHDISRPDWGSAR